MQQNVALTKRILFIMTNARGCIEATKKKQQLYLGEQ